VSDCQFIATGSDASRRRTHVITHAFYTYAMVYTIRRVYILFISTCIYARIKYLLFSCIPFLHICLMLRPCVSHCATECICTRIPLVWEREEGKGTGYGNWRVAGRGGWDGIRDACVSDVLMTLRNTEQANQYGRHCVHSGARHVSPRVIASGNVSAAFECRNESVHVQWDSSSRDTVDLSILYENLRGIPTYIYISALEIYEVLYAKFLREEISKLKALNGNDLRANALFRIINACIIY